MSVEDRLRQALRAETEVIDEDLRAWPAVQARVRRRRLARTASASVVGAAAMVALVVGIASSVDDDSQRVNVVPAADGPTSTSPTTATTATTTTATTTTTAETTTTTTTTTLPPAGADVEALAGIWPFTSQAAVDAYVAEPGVGMFFDAEATALEFARVYLGFPDPATADPVQYDGTASVFSVTARPDRPMTTAVVVRRFGGDRGPYAVTEAFTDNIRVDQPAPHGEVGLAVQVAGTSTAFEANVTVEVRQDGQAFGENLGQSFVMGGANGEMGPFQGVIDIEPPTVATGAVVFTTESAEDGAVQEATVVRVTFAQPPDR